jgi:hypothetical protein
MVNAGTIGSKHHVGNHYRDHNKIYNRKSYRTYNRNLNAQKYKRWKKNHNNNITIAASKRRWGRDWESSEMARVDHGPTLEDLSPSANTMNGSRPPTTEVGEGGKPDLSLYAPTRAHHAPTRGRPVEPLLMLVEVEGDNEVDEKARAL